jgi:hypothetical protein
MIDAPVEKHAHFIIPALSFKASGPNDPSIRYTAIEVATNFDASLVMKQNQLEIINDASIGVAHQPPA